MNRRQYLLGLAGTSLALGLGNSRFVGAARASAYPEGVVSLINGYAPGGSTDIAARLLANAALPHLGNNANIIVENRVGASGTVASEWLRRQQPDGYTLMLSESSSFAIWPSMARAGTPYDPLSDFTWLATVCTAPMVLIVAPDFPAETAQEVLEVLASPQSEEMNYASSGAGAITHIGPELFAVSFGRWRTVGPYSLRWGSACRTQRRGW